MNKKEEILKQIEIENFIWFIYIGIIGLSFYSNVVEKKYYEENDLLAKEEYRTLNIIIFTIAVFLYLYFFEDSLSQVENLKETDSYEKKFFNKANLVATSLILIAGVILLMIAIFDKNLETEIAFS